MERAPARPPALKGAAAPGPGRQVRVAKAAPPESGGVAAMVAAAILPGSRGERGGRGSRASGLLKRSSRSRSTARGRRGTCRGYQTRRCVEPAEATRHGGVPQLQDVVVTRFIANSPETGSAQR